MRVRLVPHSHEAALPPRAFAWLRSPLEGGSIFLPKPFLGECTPRASLEIAFELKGFRGIRKPRIGYELPRLELRGMDRPATIVNGESFFQVGCGADVTLFRMGCASDEIDILHEERNKGSPPSSLRRACYQGTLF